MNLGSSRIMACEKLIGLIFLLCAFSGAYSHICAPGIVSSGYTYPPGDIKLQWGEDLNITCVLNDEGKQKYGPNASNYMSYVIGDNELPVEIINSSAIRLFIKNHPRAMMSDYYCMINKSLVCHNVVTVGTPPQEIPEKDFVCVGRNYENFTCSFKAPNNYVITSYVMQYSVPLSPRYKEKSKLYKHEVTTPSIEKYYTCPTNLTIERGSDGLNVYSCTWSLHTLPQYRHSQEILLFKVVANNTFGSRVYEFKVNQYKRIRANPPENLTGMTTSPHSIKLIWNISMVLQTFPYHLTMRVSWWIQEYKNWTTTYFNTTKIEKRVTHIMENLPYAHCLYDIRVAIKVATATDEDMWSQNTSITIWTQPKAPDRPPMTTAGIFELLEGTGNRRVYWQNIHSYEENGANFSYVIEIEGHPNARPVKIQNNYAEFANLPDRNYTFKIWSSNNVSKSAEYSTVFFPAQKYLLKQQAKLIKIDKGEGDYDLEWTESNDPRLTNYTLFWCPAQKERPYPCDGVLQWKIVPRGTRNTTLRLPTHNEKNEVINIYQFAISANSYGTSSSMLWAHCTVLPGSGVKLTQTYVKDFGSRFIILKWKLECIKLGDIESFNVSYCTTTNRTESQECEPNTEQYKLFPNTNNQFRLGEGDLVLNDLKPYKGYKMAVKPIINGAKSEFGEPIFNSTLEDAPTSPQNLQVIDITDRRIVIEWEKPLEENGYLRNYEIEFNDKNISIDAVKEKQFYNATLTVLPRTKYNISVRACTKLCSTPSIIAATSDIGYPGPISKPSFNYENNAYIVKWDKPDEPGVRVDYYEIVISSLKDDNKTSVNTTNLFHKIDNCQNNKTREVYIKVRAVNVDNAQLKYGPWTEKTEIPCNQHGSSFSWMIILFTGVLCFTLIGLYFAKRIYRKLIVWRHCPVKLPAGLENVIENESKDKIIDETLQPGEPLLPGNLMKESQRDPSGGSSGCCSGTESVTSGDSAGHLSISDSGTDQPRSPSLSESEPRDVSLRQRVKKPDYVPMTEMTQSPWSSKPSPGYSVIGLAAPPIKSDIEDDYHPLSDVSSTSSYMPLTVTQPQTEIKPTTSGYVPCLPQEPAPKNTAYVVAGEPNAPKQVIKIPTALDFKEESLTDTSLTGPKSLITWPPEVKSVEPKIGYVVVGDSKTSKTDVGVQKTPSRGYVPHSLKDMTKSLKED